MLMCLLEHQLTLLIGCIIFIHYKRGCQKFKWKSRRNKFWVSSIGSWIKESKSDEILCFCEVVFSEFVNHFATFWNPVLFE